MPRSHLPQHRYAPLFRKLPAYEVGGASLGVQHIRLAPARVLTGAGIPCILWLSDAMSFAHRMPVPLDELQLLVPDSLVIGAAQILERETAYKRTSTPNPAFLDLFTDELVYPEAIRLENPDAASFTTDDAWPFLPPPYVDILPQSYFVMDTRESERFRTLVPPLHPDNAQILVPRYHTLLEGLVAGMMDPPLGPDIHRSTVLGGHLEYMVAHRLQLDPDEPYQAITPGHHNILSEVNDECRWALKAKFDPNLLFRDTRQEYHRIRDARIRGDTRLGSSKLPSDVRCHKHCGTRSFSSLAPTRSKIQHSDGTGQRLFSTIFEEVRHAHEQSPARLLIPRSTVTGNKKLAPLPQIRMIQSLFKRACRLL